MLVLLATTVSGLPFEGAGVVTESPDPRTAGRSAGASTRTGRKISAETTGPGGRYYYAVLENHHEYVVRSGNGLATKSFTVATQAWNGRGRTGRRR